MQIARKIVSHPSLSKYIAFENNPGEKVQSYDEWLDFARRSGQTTYHPDRHLQDGQRSDGGGRRASCGSMASLACAWPMRR